jgi:hypothetical protein
MIYVVIKKKTAEDCSTDLPHASKHVTTWATADIVKMKHFARIYSNNKETGK